MSKKNMIDALFGSKTRVKLLHLFLNNPGKAFYVREITRLIEEQINSVRRELANMLSIGIITSETADNKLYYQVDQRYEYYVPLRAIFADEKVAALAAGEGDQTPPWHEELKGLPRVRLVALAGIFAEDSPSKVDILIVGEAPPTKVKNTVAAIESFEGREVNYALMGYDDFYYRLSMRDRFVTEITANPHTVLVDTENILETSE